MCYTFEAVNRENLRGALVFIEKNLSNVESEVAILSKLVEIMPDSTIEGVIIYVKVMAEEFVLDPEIESKYGDKFLPGSDRHISTERTDLYLKAVDVLKRSFAIAEGRELSPNQVEAILTCIGSDEGGWRSELESREVIHTMLAWGDIKLTASRGLALVDK